MFYVLALLMMNVEGGPLQDLVAEDILMRIRNISSPVVFSGNALQTGSFL